jgi:hypothetical protein
VDRNWRKSPLLHWFQKQVLVRKPKCQPYRILDETIDSGFILTLSVLALSIYPLTKANYNKTLPLFVSHSVMKIVGDDEDRASFIRGIL